MGAQCSSEETVESLSPINHNEIEDNVYTDLPADHLNHFAERLTHFMDDRNKDADSEIIAMWKGFVNDTDGSFKKMQESNPEKFANKSPAVYWFDLFQDKMVANIAAFYPYVAVELTSRPQQEMIRILSDLMKLVLLATVETDIAGVDKYKILRIGGFHIKWCIEDAAYMTVENACLDALRDCLKQKLTPKCEVRIRVKFNFLKNAIQEAESYLVETGLYVKVLSERPKDMQCPFGLAFTNKEKEIEKYKKHKYAGLRRSSTMMV